MNERRSEGREALVESRVVRRDESVASWAARVGSVADILMRIEVCM